MLNTLNEDADAKTLPAAVVATVLEVARRAVENPDLEVEIGMAPSLPVLRVDVSNNGCLISRDAKALPGLFCSPGNPASTCLDRWLITSCVRAYELRGSKKLMSLIY